MQPPKLEKRPKKHKFHSYEIEDDYNYLEENWQEIVKDTKEILDTLWKIHRGRIKEDETSVEIKNKDYFYYSRYRKK